MIGYSRSRTDVRLWPVDKQARNALESFFDKIDPASNFIPILAAGGLDLTGADLSGMELAGAELSSAIMAGMSMRRTSLVQSWIRQADLQGADFTGANLRKALIIGCDARNSVFVDADLTETDLTNSDFRGADLHGTELVNTFMPGIDLRGANLRGCQLGTSPWNVSMHHARLAGAEVTGMRGDVTDDIDIGVAAPHVVRGDDLQQWFVDNGAPDVVVKERPPAPNAIETSQKNDKS